MTLPGRLTRFPWPLTDDAFRYSANVERAPQRRVTAAGSWGETVIDIDDGYPAVLAQRRAVLAADPSRLVELPHMRPASWDALFHVLGQAALARPGDLTFVRERSGAAETWRWTNRLLGIEQLIRFGDEASLPCSPLQFAGEQVPDDIVLLDERSGQLWVDAGFVTFASHWSLAFVVGMTFTETHGPVPRDLADGAIPRAETFLLRLQPGETYRRVNWTSTVGYQLDAALEADPGSRPPLTGDLGADLHLRVEVQHLVRLPVTGAILFLIRTHLLPLQDIALVPAWRDQLHAVLAGLPQEIADYKGLGAVRPRVLDWLAGA